MSRAQFGQKYKVSSTNLIFTIPFSSFPVSSTVFLYSSIPVLNNNAVKRRFDIVNGTDQTFTSCTVRSLAKTNGNMINTLFGLNGPTGNWANFTIGPSASGMVQELIAFVGDYVEFAASVGATAPTIGNVNIYAQEVI